MKILFCGDWHGDPLAAKAAAKKAQQEGCSIIVQCGDFGFWPHTDPGYTGTVNRYLEKVGVPMIWVDGNHENFDLLLNTEWEETERGFKKIESHIWYAPRALRWEWDGVGFLSLGGAYSMDKEWRLSQGPEGVYWWRQETITEKNVADCLSDPEPVDVMICHDMPDGVDMGYTHHCTKEDEWNQKAIRAVVDSLKPKMLFHGHHHKGQKSELRIADAPSVKIVSLDMWRGLPVKSHYYVLELAPEPDK